MKLMNMLNHLNALRVSAAPAADVFAAQCEIAEFVCPVVVGHEFMHNAIQYRVIQVSPIFYPNRAAECLWAYVAKATELYAADAAHDEAYVYRAMTMNGERFEIVAGVEEHEQMFNQ